MTWARRALLATVLVVGAACGGEDWDGPISADPGGGDDTSFTGGGRSGGGSSEGGAAYESCRESFEALNHCFTSRGFSDYYDPDEQCAGTFGVDSEHEANYYQCLADAYWSTDCAGGETVEFEHCVELLY